MPATYSICEFKDNLPLNFEWFGKYFSQVDKSKLSKTKSVLIPFGTKVVLLKLMVAKPSDKETLLISPCCSLKSYLTFTGSDKVIGSSTLLTSIKFDKVP